MRGPPSVPQVKLSLGQRQAGAKCQTTQVPASRGHQASGEGGFSQQGVTERTRRATGRASRPWGPGGRGENSFFVASYLQQCIGREKVQVGRGGQQRSRAMGGQGGGVCARLFAPCSLSLLCSQPVWEEVRNAYPQPQGPVLPGPTGL